MLDKDNLNSEISVGVTFASLMSAVSLFFTGIIIAQYKSFDPSIKVPLVFLIISTYSFIFAATIYSNAGGEVTLNKLKVVEKYMIYAKNIEEFMGLYLFILATPLVIGAVTQDTFLKIATIIIALTGITLYSQSRFSVLQRELSPPKKRLLTTVILILTVTMYLSQSAAKSSLFAYVCVSVLLLAVMIGSTVYFTFGSKQYKAVRIRDFVDSDAEALSKIILKNIGHVKTKQYPADVVETMQTESSPAAIRKLAKESQLFVAEFDHRVVGLASLNGDKIANVFTDPDLHRKGAGRLLVDYAESEASQHQHESTTVLASTIDHGFYLKLGYEDSGETSDKGDAFKLMKKNIG